MNPKITGDGRHPPMGPPRIISRDGWTRWPTRSSAAGPDVFTEGEGFLFERTRARRQGRRHHRRRAARLRRRGASSTNTPRGFRRPIRGPGLLRRKGQPKTPIQRAGQPVRGGDRRRPQGAWRCSATKGLGEMKPGSALGNHASTPTSARCLQVKIKEVRRGRRHLHQADGRRGSSRAAKFIQDNSLQRDCGRVGGRVSNRIKS